MSDPALKASNLTVATTKGPNTSTELVLSDVSLSVNMGGSVGIAGESGSGKTTLIQSLFGYARPGLKLIGGTVEILGQEIPVLDARGLGQLRGRTLALVAQSANSMLNPIMTVGQQILEVCRAIGPANDVSREQRVLNLLREVGFANPETIVTHYPHQLSGGQRQRAVLCMALIGEPRVLVLDEVTSDLDVVTQIRILNLIKQLQARHQFAVIAVSHDLRVLTALCAQILIVYRGWIVESGPLKSVLTNPSHPYTAQLVKRFTQGPLAAAETIPEDVHGLVPTGACIYLKQCPMATSKCKSAPPHREFEMGHASRCWYGDQVARHFELDREETVRHLQSGHTAMVTSIDVGQSTIRSDSAPLLKVEDLHASYRAPGMFSRRRVYALRGVSLAVRPGETVGVVGESGSGKTTLARILAGLHPPQSGRVEFRGSDITQPASERPLSLRKELQIVFQNPDTALNPAYEVGVALERRIRRFEPAMASQLAVRVKELLVAVGLRPDYAARRPQHLSGGEKQRIAIARALIGDPRLVICDEILSALDVVTQARIIQLLLTLRRERNLSLIFISHDIALTAAIAHRIVVFRDGQIVEQGTTSDVIRGSTEPYTQQLVRSALVDLAQGA